MTLPFLDESTGPLSGILALDFGQAAVGPIAAMYLGMLGATVIKVEPPKGDLVRWSTPIIGGAGTTFIGNNLTKLGVEIDLKTAEGMDGAKELIAHADILIENFRSPAIMERLGLGYPVMAAINPRLIYVQASAFGREGPWVGMFSHEWIAQTVSGFVSVTGDRNGIPEWSRGTANLDWNGAMMNLTAMLAGLIKRAQTGHGMMIETAQLGSSIFAGITRYAELLATGKTPHPMGSSRPNIVPDQSFKTADGYINVCVPAEKFWQPLCNAIGQAAPAEFAALNHERFSSNQARIRNREELAALLEEIFIRRRSAEWLALLGAAQVPSGPHPRDRMLSDILIDHEQVAANAMMCRVDTPYGEIRSAAPHWKFEKTPGAIKRGSPLLGQHTRKVLSSLAGSNTAGARNGGAAANGGNDAHTSAEADGPVLAGMRVLELAEGVPGPLCGMVLASLGAEVIKVEPPAGDWMRTVPPLVERQSASFAQINGGKRGITLDLKTAEGRIAIANLAATCDVVVTGYRPGKLDRLGISYALLAMTNPKLVHCQITGWGSTGPSANQPATELSVQAMAGLIRHLGLKDGEPVRQGFDIVSVSTGLAAAQAILAALYWRIHSGAGQTVEVSMLATAIAINQWDIVAESETASREGPSPGLQLEAYDRAPDRGFRCADGSCLVDFLGHEEGWSLFFAGLDRPDLLADPRFNTIQLIRNNKYLLNDLLNPTLESWSLARLEALVREHGGTILPALDLSQVIAHPQVKTLDMIVPNARATEPAIRLPFRSTQPLQVASLRPAPHLGEHTDEVLARTERISELAK
jgi:crotonobetainyl-CoA:carnitine CoA-transferase CaiB-like acyl-CoA transferase